MDTPATRNPQIPNPTRLPRQKEDAHPPMTLGISLRQGSPLRVRCLISEVPLFIPFPKLETLKRSRRGGRGDRRGRRRDPTRVNSRIRPREIACFRGQDRAKPRAFEDEFVISRIIPGDFAWFRGQDQRSRAVSVAVSLEKRPFSDATTREGAVSQIARARHAVLSGTLWSSYTGLFPQTGDTTPCRMTGVTLHWHAGVSRRRPASG